MVIFYFFGFESKRSIIIQFEVVNLPVNTPPEAAARNRLGGGGHEERHSNSAVGPL